MRLARMVSHASWVLPLLSIVLAGFGGAAAHDLFHSEQLENIVVNLCRVVFVTGGCCGVIALLGILWWGDRYWAYATVGLAFTIYLVLEFRYGR